MVLHEDKHPGPPQGTTPSHTDPRGAGQLVTVTTFCPDCRLILFPGEECRRCSGDVERWMRETYGMEARVRD